VNWERITADAVRRVEVCAVREQLMNAMTSSEQIAGGDPTTNEFEGEIREFVRKDVAPWRKRPDRVDASADTQAADNVSMLVQRVAGASMSEIDNVIEELRTMREYLRSEGERVQREIAGYATVSQTAAASMKVIAESMSQWRSASGAPTPPPYRG
jgi:hypothetical protein